MIPYSAAERFAKSKLALIIGLVMVVGVLVSVIVAQHRDAQIDAATYRNDIAAKEEIIRLRDSTIYDCKEQSRIDAQNATAAEKRRAENYEKLYLEVMDLKDAARRKNLIP
jgi:hypothetical protein